MVTVSVGNADAQNASFHARLRWVGAPLLLSGFVMLMWALTLAGRGGSLLTVMFGLFGCGMALASFGANHDTALALAIRSRSGLGEPPALAPGLAREVADELEHDRAATMSLRASPRIAMALPLVALMVQSFVFWRLFTGA